MKQLYRKFASFASIAAVVMSYAAGCATLPKKDYHAILKNPKLFSSKSSKFAVGDVDGDRLDDIVAVTNHFFIEENVAEDRIDNMFSSGLMKETATYAEVYVLKNKGNNKFDRYNVCTVLLYWSGMRERNLHPDINLALGDLDNDGDLDMAIANGIVDSVSARMHLFENKGNCWLEHTGSMKFPLPPDSRIDVIIRDNDNDGMADVFIAIPYRRKKTRVYKFKNAGQFEFEPWQWQKINTNILY